MTEQDEVQFYLHNWKGFLYDFFQLGNRDLTIKVSPHNCATGVWYEATWLTSSGEKRRASSMHERLMKERIIKVYLTDFRELVAGDSY